MAAAGVLLGVALLVLMALRGINVIVASLVAATVVAITNGRPLPAALTKEFVGGLTAFAGQFILVFLAGAVFGRVMGESKAAASVALALHRRLGPERVMLIIVLAAALLTYGGVNVFVVVFTIYPLGLGLMQHADLPKRLLVGPITLGAGTFTMTALPGSPALQNIIASQGLKTPLTAAPVVGLLASAAMFVMGMWYLERERIAARRRGETFRPRPGDVVGEVTAGAGAMPHPVLALVPLAAVLLSILLPPWLIATIQPAGHAAPLPGWLAFARDQPVPWIALTMGLGTLLALGCFRRSLPDAWGAVSRGADGAMLPLVSTGAVIGFGSVVKSTDAFSWFAESMLGSGVPPLLSAAVTINIMAGIVGSATGGLGIFMDTVAARYLESGVSPELLHRVVTIGSGGLDSLPHSGAVVSFLAVMGLTHREAYRDIGVVSVVIPLAALALVLIGLAALGIR